jgi:hypothetical protein
MEDSLSFLAGDSGDGLCAEEELRRVQFWAEHDYVPRSLDDPWFRTYQARWSFDDFRQWRAAADGLRRERDKLGLFARFVRLEAEIEPLEQRIHEAASLLDQAIQLAMDIARGK